MTELSFLNVRQKDRQTDIKTDIQKKIDKYTDKNLKSEQPSHRFQTAVFAVEKNNQQKGERSQRTVKVTMQTAKGRFTPTAFVQP